MLPSRLDSANLLLIDILLTRLVWMHSPFASTISARSIKFIMPPYIINEVKKVKTNCSNDEKELFEFMKNRVNEKMESLDKFDEMLNNDDLYENVKTLGRKRKK